MFVCFVWSNIRQQSQLHTVHYKCTCNAHCNSLMDRLNQCFESLFSVVDESVTEFDKCVDPPNKCLYTILDKNKLGARKTSIQSCF